MFTGIIEEIGTVKKIMASSNFAKITISCSEILSDVNLGDSISVNGVCLTVTDYDSNGFTADVMHETLNRSSLGSLRNNSLVNLERAMSPLGRFGGHIVSGHIDGTGTIKSIKKDSIATWYEISCNNDLLKYIIEKGSIAIDGISLTVAKVHSDGFSVSIIPHTSLKTILSLKKTGDVVNLENDCIGKYIDRLMSFKEVNNKKNDISLDFLIENGF